MIQANKNPKLEINLITKSCSAGMYPSCQDLAEPNKNMSSKLSLFL
jgi:hypothetical protein